MQYVSPMKYAQFLILLGLEVAARKPVSDETVSRVVSGCIKEMLASLPVQNIPAGPAIPPTSITIPKDQANDANVLARLQQISATQAPGSIFLTLFCEAHRKPNDQARARTLLAQMSNSVPFQPTFSVFERTLKETYNPALAKMAVDELNLTIAAPQEDPDPILQNIIVADTFQPPLRTNISNVALRAIGSEVWFGEGLTKRQRSMVVAGYILLCLASGDQTHTDKVIVFFGEEHEDILNHFETLAGTLAPYVQGRTRTFLIVKSLN